MELVGVLAWWRLRANFVHTLLRLLRPFRPVMLRRGRGARAGARAGGRGGARGGRGGRRRTQRSSNWTCKACCFENSEFLPYCEGCSTKRGEVVALSAAVEAVAAVSGGGLPADFFLSSANFPTHVQMLRAHRDTYFRELTACISNGMALNGATRARTLAAAWATGEKQAVDDLLALRDVIGVNEVVKALQLLDAPRASRRLTDKIERVRATAKPATIGKLETDLTNLRAEMLVGERVGSVSRSLTKRIQRWVSGIPASSLEFYLLSFPTGPWKAVADLCHLKASDFQLAYFLPAVFGGVDAIPADSLVGRGRALSAGNLAATLEAEPRFLEMYSFIRKSVPPSAFTDAVKTFISARAPLGEVVWWFHELECDGGAVALRDRLTTCVLTASRWLVVLCGALLVILSPTDCSAQW